MDNNLINEIKNKTNIVDVISSYLPLTKRGKNHFGVCPFHDDNNPSMSVSEDKQIYKCFSCGASGNVFNFVADYENISFTEAATLLGEKVNIKIENNNYHKKESPLFDMYKLATKFYQNNIYSKEGLQAREYLKNRQIDESIIKEFEIGLSLKDSTYLTKILQNKNFKNIDLEKSGLINKHDRGYSDLYIDRIMFPLYDLSGKVAGFSGRVYNKIDNSKYINTRETEIFKKGELLYNYHKAKLECRVKNKVIIMEGFMDVIRAYTVDVRNVVATMGTSVTKYQANLIKKLAKEIILCFDGDEAGIKAALKVSDELISLGVTPKIVVLENNLDPDEYIVKYGKEKFLAKLDNPLNVMDFKLKYFKRNVDFNSTQQISNYLNQMIIELNKIDDDILRELTIKKLSEETSLDVEFLKSKLNNIEEKQEVVKIKKVIKEDKKIDKYELASQYILYYMLINKNAIKLYLEHKPFMPNDLYRKLAHYIEHYYKENSDIEVSNILIEVSQNENLSKLIRNIIALDIKEEFTNEELIDYFNTIKQYNINTEIERLKKLMNEETIPIEKAKIADKIVKLKKGEYV